jgi:hypothetical protein
MLAANRRNLKTSGEKSLGTFRGNLGGFRLDSRVLRDAALTGVDRAETVDRGKIGKG